MEAAEHTELVAIDLPRPAAADAVLYCWQNDEAVFVLDESMPEEARMAQIWRVRPTAIVDASGRRRLDGVPVEADTAAVVTTSGITSAPKPVVLTRGGMEAMTTAYSRAIGVSAGDRWLAVVPLSGVAGLAILARSYESGVPVTVHARFEVDRVARAPQNEGVTIVSVVPTMLHRLLEPGRPLDQYRVILVGGSALTAQLRDQAETARAAIVETYGLTETWGGFVLEGRPINGADVRIGDESEIQVRGRMVSPGYRLDQVATEAGRTADGWLKTGDAGRLSDGILEVADRLDDLIVTGGVNVSPSAVEHSVVTHERVADVCVAGMPDVEWGQVVTAFVVPASPMDPPGLDELRDHAKASLGDAESPRRLILVDAIPRNGAGKPQRRRLVETHT